MRPITIVISALLAILPANAFFVPFTMEQRVAASDVIAVVEVLKADYEVGFSEANVITGVFGAKAGEKIVVWDDVRFDGSGKPYAIEGRDTHLEEGNRYFIYLTKNKGGKLVTVQSFLDALKVVEDSVEREGQEGFESLKDKIERVGALIEKTKKAEP